MNSFFEGLGVAIAILLITTIPIIIASYIGKLIDNRFNFNHGDGMMVIMTIFFCLFIGITNYILNKDK